MTTKGPGSANKMRCRGSFSEKRAEIHKNKEKTKIVIFLTKNLLPGSLPGGIIEDRQNGFAAWARPGLGRFAYEGI